MTFDTEVTTAPASETQPVATRSTEASRALRAMVLSKVGRLTPRWSGEIHELVESDWGTVTQRSIQRVLATLLKAGEIRTTPDGYLLVRARP